LISRVAVFVSVLLLSSVLLAQDDKSAALLAAARQALGGDAALAAVKSWTANGVLERHIGPRPSPSAIEIMSVLPDRFVQVFRQAFFGFSTTRSVGFNGDEPVFESVTTGSAPPLPPMPRPGTPEGLAAQRASQTNRAKREFIRVALPLFASSFPSYPVTLVSAGTASLATGAAHVLEGKGPDGWAFKLFLDASTHLPVRVSWMDKPLVTFVASQTVTMPVNSRGQPVGPPIRQPQAPAMPPPGDPTAGMADVEWELVLSDHRKTDGVLWPHRMVTSYAGKIFEDTKVDRFRINPDIDPKVFTPTR
jgi:hypothetical protein